MKKSMVAATLVVALMSGVTAAVSSAQVSNEAQVVAALDSDYQSAVKNNNAAGMDQIFGEDFVVISGSGKAYTKADLLQAARTRRVHYEHQEDSERKVQVWGNTAVVTAKLWAKGTDHGQPFDYFVWFSDTYVRTPAGWRYVHGQASLPLPRSAPTE